MNSWTDLNGATSERYIKTLRLRTITAQRVYRCILRCFERFVAINSPHSPLSRETIEDWLHDRNAVWPLHMVLHRARIVSRFLEWLVSEKVLLTNPLADLQHTYGQRTTIPIVRALLKPNPDEALEALRPLPPFASSIGPALYRYVTLMKALGYKYTKREKDFLRFDRFLQTHPNAEGQPLGALIRGWAKLASSYSGQLGRMRIGRVVARAVRRKDLKSVSPQIDSRLVREAKRERRPPYIYTKEEVEQLLSTARHCPSPLAPLRPLTLYTMLLLAYCLGLRLGEIARLKIGDVDFHDRSIDIRESKFFKHRRLPLPSSVMVALCKYLDARKLAGASAKPGTSLFWHEQRRHGYSPFTIQKLLTQVIRESGLKLSTGRKGPRIHDLRHTMAVHRLTAWYKEGIDVQTRLPHLSTYLGHKNIQSTLVYLTMTEELLNQANTRFHRYGARLLTGGVS